MIEQRIKVNADIHAVPPIVSMVQEDTGRTLICELEDYTVTGAEGVALMCVRPDGTAYSYAGTANDTDNTAEFDLDVAGGALSQAGMVAARVIMTIGSDIVSTFKFGIKVEEEIGGVATQDDVTFLEGLQAQLTAAISGYKVNGQAMSANTLLKSAQFAEAITGEKMLANLTYTVISGNTISLVGQQISMTNVTGNKGELPSNADFNSYNSYSDNGIYYIGNSSDMTNAPSSWGFLMVLAYGSVVVQVCFALGGKIYMRGYSQASWAAWKSITLA